ncbi:MAG: hypothetical protein KBD01_16240 [Acidobacteria bacterium]|nr:hypothetical protein [Acidobacteriota bacterium]
MLRPAHRIPPLAAALVLVATASPRAATLYVTPDVPADLSGATYKASDIAAAADASYALALALPENARIDALQRLSSGQWLVSFEAPTRIGIVEYDPRDVVRTDGASFSLFWSGSTNGIPAGVNIDALALAGSDTAPLLLSIDVPAQIAGLNVRPADVLRWSGGSYTKSFDATAAGVPEGVNLVGLDAINGGLLLSFDVPVDLAALRALPGDVVLWDGLAFSMFRQGSPNGWLPKHELAGFGLPAAPGRADSVMVANAGAGQLSVSWAASCSTWASDYGIYAGTIGGTFTSHSPLDCADAGNDHVELVSPPAGNVYFLVVPLSATEEGSYGGDSAGHERPRGTTTCRAAQGVPVCP